MARQSGTFSASSVSTANCPRGTPRPTRAIRRTARPPRAGGFTLIELGALIVVAIMLTALVISLMPASRLPPRTLKDSSHVRGILQGMVLWADSNKDQFPLPSAVDTDDATVPEQGAAKDTTANILALMIHNGFFPVELAVSPLEVGNIERMESYRASEPPAAVDPARALWDPAFSADFTGAAPGNTSYAHMAPIGPRRQHWSLATGDATRAIFGNRGPQVTSVAPGTSGPIPALATDSSNTLLIHGPRDRWHGHIGYQDNHVSFETSMAPEELLYTLPSGARQRDTLFYDEPDDATGDNNYLTVTIPAAGVAGGRAIWD